MLAAADVVIVGKQLPDVAAAAERCCAPDQTVIDLVGIDELTGALRPWAVGSRARARSTGSQ